MVVKTEKALNLHRNTTVNYAKHTWPRKLKTALHTVQAEGNKVQKLHDKLQPTVYRGSKQFTGLRTIGQDISML